MLVQIKLNEREEKVVNQLCEDKALEPDQLFRQALRLYQLKESNLPELSKYNPIVVDKLPIIGE